MKTYEWYCLLALLAAGCVSGRDVELRLEWPAAWGERPAAGVTVVLVDGDAQYEEVTDAEGFVRFEGVGAGSVRVEAHVALAADRVFELTGHRLATVAALSTELDPLEETTLTLAAPRLGGWVIGESYYTGSPGVGGVHYFGDQFLEIVNNSTETLYADGLLLGDVHGPSGPINPGTMPSPYASDAEHVYLQNLWRLPGSGTDHPVPPGGALVIAQTGSNHMPMSVLDLSDADFETYNDQSERDVDSPTVPNLERVHYTAGFDWLVTVFGPALVLIAPSDVSTFRREPTGIGDRVVVPVAAVLDGVEALMDAESGAFARLPPAVDRGFVHASGTYTGESVERRVAARIAGRVVLVDTDDSSADFVVRERPTPGELSP